MPITLEQIVEETRKWPTEKVGELVDRLTQELNPGDADAEASWIKEARRRLAEIESGNVHPVDGEMVASRVRKIVGR